MDYVREELLRQQAALTALLVGGERSVERAEETAFPVERAAAPMEAGETAMKTVWPGAETVPEGGADGRRPARRAVSAAKKREQSEELLRQQGGAAARGTRAAETSGAVFWETAPAAVGGTERTVVETVTPAFGRPERGAAELSRAFQRDARRYDGGFALY